MEKKPSLSERQNEQRRDKERFERLLPRLHQRHKRARNIVCLEKILRELPPEATASETIVKLQSYWNTLLPHEALAVREGVNRFFTQREATLDCYQMFRREHRPLRTNFPRSEAELLGENLFQKIVGIPPRKEVRLEYTSNFLELLLKSIWTTTHFTQLLQNNPLLLHPSQTKRVWVILIPTLHSLSRQEPTSCLLS